MAERKLGLRLGIEGETEYKKAISDINRSTQVLNSEMKKLAEEYKGSENSMDALKEKAGVLERQLLTQKEKVATLRDAVKNAVNSFGEADKRTQSWIIQLNNAERDQIKLERALEETNKEIKAQGDETENDAKQMQTLGDQISSIADKFGIRIPQTVKSALDNVNGFSTGTVVAMGAAVTAVDALELGIKAIGAGIQAVQKLNEMTLEQAQWADELLTRGAQTGLDTTTLQGLDYASNFLDFDGLEQSLSKLTVSMDKARDGAKDQAKAFASLGLSVTDTDGKLRDNWETFKDVIDALGTVENATERDALANDIFGKSYAELKPLIDAGSDSLQRLTDEAKENDLILSEEHVKALGEVDDAHQKYQAQIEATKQKLAAEFAPVSKEVMEKFGNFFQSAGESIVESGIIGKLGNIVEPLGRILDTLGGLIDWALPGVGTLLDAFAEGLEWVASAAEKAATWLQESVTWTKEQFALWSERRSENIYDSSSNAWNAAGDSNWRGGLTWVGESGPELVRLPRGTAIYSNQESRQMTAATDTGRIESLLERALDRLDRIDRELEDFEAVRRMA